MIKFKNKKVAAIAVATTIGKTDIEIGCEPFQKVF